MTFLLAMICVISFIILLPLAWAGLSYAPWVPTHIKDLERIARLANLKSHETFFELGCGNGRVILYLARHCVGHFVGIERAWPLFMIAWMRARFSPRPRPRIVLGDIFKSDLKNADVIFTFGMPGPLREKLAPRIMQQCKPGTRIISYTFRIKQWQPTQVDKPDSHHLSIYLYIL